MSVNNTTLPPDAFGHVGEDLRAQQAIMRPSTTYWRDAMRRLR